MKKRNKKILAVLLIVSIAAINGCGKKNQPVSSSKTNSKKQYANVSNGSLQQTTNKSSVPEEKSKSDSTVGGTNSMANMKTNTSKQTSAQISSSSQTSESNPSPSPSSVSDNDFTDGNTLGNVINGGFAAYDNTYIYYAKSSQGGALYRIKTDGTNDTKIADGSIGNINLKGEYIYYSKFGQNSGIYKVKKDGSGNTKVSSVNSYNMQLEGNYIYYIVDEASGGAFLHRMKTDGTGDIRVKLLNSNSISVEEGYPFTIYNGFAYINAYVNSKLSFIRSNAGGSPSNIIVNTQVDRSIPIGNWLYYINLKGIYKIKTDGTQNTLVNGDTYTKGYVYDMNIAGNYIYYTVRDADVSDSPDNGIYRIGLDGSGKTRLTDHPARYLCVVSDWIYFDTGNSDGYFRIKTNGTNLGQVP